MAVDSNAIVSETEAGVYLQVASTEAGLEVLINRLTVLTEEHCQRDSFVKPGADEEEIHNGNGCSKFWIRKPPIVTLTSLEELLADRTTWQALISTEYAYQLATGRIQFLNGAVFTKGFQNIRVTYIGGYANTAGIPKGLKHAFLLWLGHEWRRFNDKAHGITSINMADHSITFDNSSMPKHVRDAMAPYRRMTRSF